MTEYITEISTMPRHADEVGRAIARRAFARFKAEGSTHGRDLDHWLEAERQMQEITLPYGFEEDPDALTLRIALDASEVTRLVVSIAEGSILLFASEPADAAEERSLFQIISLPAKIVPDATQAALEERELILALRTSEVPMDT